MIVRKYTWRLACYKCGLMPKYYINSILEKDIYESKNVDSVKMQKLLKSLARNESTVVSNNKLIKDISDNDDLNIDKRTVSDYIEILEKLNNETDYEIIAKLSAELETISEELEMIELRWLELQESIG